MQLARACAPTQRAQLRAVPLRATVPLRRARQLPSRGATTVAGRSFWRRLADGARVGERELRLKQSPATKWDNEHLSAAAAEHMTEHGEVDVQVPPHYIDRTVLTGVDNEPQPHHHDVPTIPARHVTAASPHHLPPYPPQVHVKVPRIPAGILITSVRAPTPPMALEGPVATGVGVGSVLLVAFAIVVLGRMAARRRDSRSPEQPLFRPRFPRWWWLP
jgi:hypothetical protein